MLAPWINKILTGFACNLAFGVACKKETNPYFQDLYQDVNPLVQNSNSFLDDLRRLNQLKDSPYQQDLNTEKENQLKPKQPQVTTKSGKLKR